MKKYILLLLAIFPLYMSAQMTDSQVMEYVKTEHAKGVSQQQIGTNLIQKGVTKDQLERIKNQVERDNQTNTTSNNRESTSDPVRRKAYIEETTADKKYNRDSTYLSRADIFGKNIFNQKNLSFIPDVNIPTPMDYKLGPGDEVVIEVWGDSESTVRQTISPEGFINVEFLGPVPLNGMTVEEANDYIKRKFASMYSGIDEYNGSSHIKLTLGQIRTIQINVMGEVAVPGTYYLSSLSSMFHALYLAGGINDIGSLREINLYRKGKKVASIDIYSYLLNGRSTNDIRLFDGDIIIVPPYQSLVNITGMVKRPMFYEMKEKETVGDLISYAGGFVAGAYSDRINILRKTGGYDKIFTLSDENKLTFELADGDVINIDKGFDQFANRVQISGSIFRPGYYEIGADIKTVKNLIEQAGGVKEDAFLGRAILTREKPDLTLETLALNLNEIMSEKSEDIPLRKNDSLYIATNKIDIDLGPFSIFGMVANPGSYPYADNTTIKDLILTAGGLLSSASTAKVDVSRRIVDPTCTTSLSTISESFTFSIEDGLIVNGKSDFILQPYDHVYIRRSPGYSPQRNVSIEGEVLFPGEYALEIKEQRISDLVKQAGNLTKHAFPEGAQLIRRQNDAEIARQKQSLEVIARGGVRDSIAAKSLDTELNYPIGIELQKAINNPQSEYDLVLRPGDKLIIPEFNNTIKINGAVMYPNTVLYQKGEKLNYYINQAGGYNDAAEKKRAYIVYMNGTLARANSSSRELIKPGCEIIVPTKERKQKMSTGEIISISTSVVSMATVIALLINSLSK